MARSLTLVLLLRGLLLLLLPGLLLLALFVLLPASDEIGGRPTRPGVVGGATSSQSLDRLGLPTFPLRIGGVAPVPVPDDLTSFCQSCSQTKLPASM